MKITPAETAIMDVLWRTPEPAAAEAIRDQLDEDWSEATVRTLLTRLVNKKAVAQSKDGRRFLYQPLIARAAYVHEESRNLIDRLFGGRITPFVTQLSEREQLSREEIEELKQLIERLDRDR